MTNLGVIFVMNRLLTTKEVAELTGLSEYELRLGAKQGRYPVILLGSRDSQFRRMRWNLEALQDVIQKQMQETQKERKKMMEDM